MLSNIIKITNDCRPVLPPSPVPHTQYYLLTEFSLLCLVPACLPENPTLPSPTLPDPSGRTCLFCKQHISLFLSIMLCSNSARSRTMCSMWKGSTKHDTTRAVTVRATTEVATFLAVYSLELYPYKLLQFQFYKQ